MIQLVQRLYKKWVDPYVIRKLNLGIGIALLCVFLLIGFFTHHSYYNMLEEREKALLDARTWKLHDELQHILTRFKQETMSLYRSSGETPATYRYFLPGNVPGGDKQKQLADRNFFSGLQSQILERNPRSLGVAMYRLADEKLYVKSQYPSLLINDDFLVNELFASMPKNYEFPYIGKTDQLYTNLNRPVLYIVSPVFNFNNIHYGNVQGYFMVVLDSHTLINLFHSEEETHNRVIIQHGEETLLDSREERPLYTIDDVLSHTVTMDDFDLDIIGITHKGGIQSRLTDITIWLFGGLVFAWLICMWLIQYILKFVIRRLQLMTQHFKKVQSNPFVEPMEVLKEDEIGHLIKSLNLMTKHLQDHINHVYIANIQRSKAEYMALKMQINPHFLYNTLESLRMQALINKQPILAEKLFYLGKLYRWILKTDRDEISIEEELEYTRYYLDLYMMGKSKTIELEVNVETGLNELMIPKFSLQPIMENAILHGKLEEEPEPVIEIRVIDMNDLQIITVWNNGTSISDNKRQQLNEILQEQDVFKKEHLGLKNVHERIRAYYGDEYGLTIPLQNPNNGFKICMILPKKWEQSKEVTPHA